VEWPNQFLKVLFCLEVVAIVVPWLIPSGRRMVLLGLIFALATTGSWVAYEIQIQSIARPGDPLIRVDLFLIMPLLALAWVSTLASIVLRCLRVPKTEPAQHYVKYLKTK
jgi:hypothetical protein